MTTPTPPSNTNKTSQQTQTDTHAVSDNTTHPIQDDAIDIKTGKTPDTLKVTLPQSNLAESNSVESAQVEASVSNTNHTEQADNEANDNNDNDNENNDTASTNQPNRQASNENTHNAEITEPLAKTTTQSDNNTKATNTEAVKKPLNSADKKPVRPTHPITQYPNKYANKKKGIRWGAWLISIVLIIIFSGLLVIYQTLFGQMERSTTFIEVEQGETYYSLVNDWKKEVPFFSLTVAKMYLKSKGEQTLHSGTYEIPKNPSFYRVVKILSDGVDSALVKIQIIEGKKADDLYTLLKNTKGVKIEVLDKPATELKSILEIEDYVVEEPIDGSLAPTNKEQSNDEAEFVEEIIEDEFATNLEGWFAPNTYKYSEGTTDEQILKDLYRRQRSILDKAWEQRAPDLPYKTPYEALIMASIIEKETGLSEERALVAGVFVNRLRKGMRLQTDPTIIYGMGERYQGNITKADIKEKTAYNTYQIDGLPPTPISLPSFAAIDAALNPAETKALFFVATGKGGHKFSETYEEHKEAVAEYLKVIRSIKKDN